MRHNNGMNTVSIRPLGIQRASGCRRIQCHFLNQLFVGELHQNIVHSSTQIILGMHRDRHFVHVFRTLLEIQTGGSIDLTLKMTTRRIGFQTVVTDWTFWPAQSDPIMIIQLIRQGIPQGLQGWLQKYGGVCGYGVQCSGNTGILDTITIHPAILLKSPEESLRTCLSGKLNNYL